MSTPKTIQLLNGLMARHQWSLPMYLASAPPWSSPRDAPAVSVLRHIADDQRLMADRIGAVILSEGGTVLAGEFPMSYTDLHDVSIEYLLPQVIRQQRDDVQYIQAVVGQIRESPVARAIAEEALGAAMAHGDSLTELSTPTVHVG